MKSQEFLGTSPLRFRPLLYLYNVEDNNAPNPNASRLNSKKSFSIASKPPASATSLKHKKAVSTIPGMSIIKEIQSGQNSMYTSSSAAPKSSANNRAPSSNLLSQISNNILKKITEKSANNKNDHTPNKTPSNKKRLIIKKQQSTILPPQQVSGE